MSGSSKKQHSCPACGAPVQQRFKHSRQVVCEYCSTTIFIEDEMVKNAGVKSVLADQPSILKLQQSFRYRGWSFMPIGQVRYDFGKGWWDEWWVLGLDGQNKWISVDEGDIAIEVEMKINEKAIPAWGRLKLGQEFKLKGGTMVVTEKNTCTMTGFRGELPFQILPNETYQYADLTGADGAIISIEYFPDEVDMFEGKWVDPFDMVEA